MKKSLILLVCALCSVMTFSACDFLFGQNSSEDSSSVSEVESESSVSEEASDSEEDEESSNQDIAEVFVVTFSQKDQLDHKVEVVKGEDVAEEEIPEVAPKVGYTVVWEEVDLTNVQKNITVNAIETANTYIVTYDAGEGTVEMETQEVTYDSEYTHPTPIREDWGFISWNYEGNAVSGPIWKIADNVTLVAEWEDMRPTFEVTFKQGTELKVVSVKKGEAVSEEDIPKVTEKTGYTVDWEKVDLTNVQENITVNAIETANTYTVTYDADGFEIDGTTVALTYDAICTALDMSLTREDANFLGWKYGNATYTQNSIWNVAENVTLVADWAAKDQLLVTFVNADGSRVNKTVYAGAELTDIPTPTAKVGYTVDSNWYTDEACENIAVFTAIQEEMTVYAKATPKTYTIMYNANGGTVAEGTQSVTYDAEYTLVTPTREGYWSFDGWFNEQNIKVTDGVWKTDADVTLTASWKDTRKDFKITFIQDGQANKSFDVKQGDNFTEIPEVVPVVGYTVVWEEVDLTNIQSNITVEAKATPKTYTITYNANGGMVAEETQSVTYDAEYTLATPTRVGYTFNGWKNGDTFMANTGNWTIDDNNVVLVADWTAKTYSVTLDLDGGSCNQSVTVTYGEAIGTLPTPTRSGYTFVGWTYNEETLSASYVWMTDAENITFKANWSKKTEADDDNWTNNY